MAVPAVLEPEVPFEPPVFLPALPAPAPALPPVTPEPPSPSEPQAQTEQPSTKDTTANWKLALMTK
jgi:hypothetical protein